MIFTRTGESRAMHEGREPDALPDAQRRVDLVEARPLGVIVGDRQRAIEERRHVDRVAHHLTDGARIAGANEVAPPQRVRCETNRRGNAIHVSLERKQALRRAETAEGAVRRRIGRDGAAAQPHVRAEIGPGGVNRAAGQHDGRQRAVRAAVDDEVDVHGHEAPVSRYRSPMPRPRRMALGGRDHILGAIVNKLHRRAGLPGEKRRVAGDDGRVLFLAAEAAAGFHLHNADLVRRQVEDRLQRLVDVVRALHRTPDRDAIGAAGRRHHPVRFDIQLFLRASLVFALDDDVRGGNRGVDITACHHIVLEDVVAAPHDRVTRERLIHREHGWLGINHDVYATPRFFDEMAIRVSQEHDRLFWMIDAIGRQAGLVVDDEGDSVDAGHVGGRHDDEVRPGNVGIEVDALDQPTRGGAPDRRAEEHSRQGEIVDVLRPAGDLGPAFAAGNRQPDGGHLRRICYPGLLEGLARLYISAIEAAAKPGDSLLGRTVGKAIRRDPRSGHPLDAVVADRGGSVQPFIDVAGLELHFPLSGPARLRGVMAPDAGETVGLQLEPDRQLVLLIWTRLLEAADLRLDAEQMLHVVPKLVRQHVGLRKIARRAEPLLKLGEESQVEVNERIGRAVEGTGRGLRGSASRLNRVTKDHGARLLIPAA